MRIVFVGEVEFSREMLEATIASGGDIVGVITRRRSKVNSDSADLLPLCRQHEIPSWIAQDLNEGPVLSLMRNLRPDIMFCFGWSSLLKRTVLDLPPMGVLGYHPAALPLNRGRHPLIWALALGLEQTGSTFFFMDEGADSGDILSQRQIDIEYSDNAASLYEKVTMAAKGQLQEFLPMLQRNSYPRTKQDHSRANYWRKRGERDGAIDFRMSCRAIYNLVRALTRPYIGAHVEAMGGKPKIWKVKELPSTNRNIEPGRVLSVDSNGQILVQCYDGCILLVEHDFRTLPISGTYL